MDDNAEATAGIVNHVRPLLSTAVFKNIQVIVYSQDNFNILLDDIFASFRSLDLGGEIVAFFHINTIFFSCLKAKCSLPLDILRQFCGRL